MERNGVVVKAVPIEAVDLFCGVGGLSLGLMRAKIRVRLGVDFDKHCRYAYERNISGAHFSLGDIGTAEGSTLSAHYSGGAVRLLAGCAPCQPFSTLRNGTDAQSSDKWPLLNHFGRLVCEMQPDLVTMENVPALMKNSIFKSFVDGLTKGGYHVWHQIVDAAAYGVAQRRRRLVLLASRFGAVELLSPSHLGCTAKTVQDVIGALPPIASGEESRVDRLHKARNVSSLNMRRLRASRPGGTWEDWPAALRSPCHQRESGSSFKSVYARMEWQKASPTITTQASNFGTGRFGHPEQDRAMSLREMALLQSFPIDYEFVAPDFPVQFTPVGRLIGNAVPPDLGYAIGASFVHHIKGASSHVGARAVSI